MSYRLESRTDTGRERGANPLTTQPSSLPGSTDSAAEVLQLRLQAQGLLNRALEVENTTLRDELDHLRRHIQTQDPPVGDQPVRHQLAQRPLAERIGLTGQYPPPVLIVSGRGRPFTPRAGPLVQPTITAQSAGVHPRFLPLGENFQEGGTGGPAFSRPQEWPDAINRNPSARPRGIRRWGHHPVNLDDLHVYTQIGQIVYGGNRPPGRRDPVDSRRQWKAIEAAFFRETVLIILRPHLFTEMRGQLTFIQSTPLRQPFLANVEDPTQLATRDVVQHLVQSGITDSWIRLDTVIGFARSYLRDWARHQMEVNATTELGQLFRDLYPRGIINQNDRQFVEDAATAQDEMWEGTTREVTMGEDNGHDNDDVPSLESVTPSTPSPPPGIPRDETPFDEKLDWGEDEL